MLILLAPVIPLLGIYLNQITQNIFFKHWHKKSPLKYYLQCLPMTTSYSPTHHESQVVWLGFLRDSPRDIFRFPNLTMHLYMKLWPFMCKEELLPFRDACPLAMWYCFSTLQEVKSIYPSFDLSLAMQLALANLTLANRMMETLQNDWEILACKLGFLFQQVKPWDQPEPNLACWKGPMLENRGTLANSLPMPDMGLSPSRTVQPQPSHPRPQCPQPSQLSIESWAKQWLFVVLTF